MNVFIADELQLVDGLGMERVRVNRLMKQETVCVEARQFRGKQEFILVLCGFVFGL